jgi:hypothetical protein
MRTLAITLAATAAFAVRALAGAPVLETKNVAPPAEREDIVVHPITGPYYHEDSFITTDIRAWFVQHYFDGTPFAEGHARVGALQLRVRILKNLQFVAYKDGWLDIDSDALDDSGWNDIGAGLKFAFLQMPQWQLDSAIGAGYQFASGDDQVLQDKDEVRVWWSINKGFGPLHLGATVNYFLATDNNDGPLGQSNHMSWHFHADYQVCKWFSPVIELNGYHVIDEDDDVVTPFSGVDVTNLGGNRNENVVTLGLGAELRPFDFLAVRAAYELPLTDDVDVFGHRWTFSAVVKF